MTGERSERPGRGWWIGFALVLAACAAVRVAFVARTLPYALHVDEALIARPAARMLAEGHASPGYFQYPSLPIYLTAGALALGAALDDGASVGDVGALRPAYGRPRAMGAARVLFALFGTAAMGLAAVAGWRAFGEPALLVLVPLVLSLSGRFLLQSWLYLNVDVVGAFVCTGALAVLFATRERRGVLHRAVLPGLLTGFAVGSKYYLGLVGLPFALVIALDPDRRARKLALVAAFTVVGFLLTTPYALLDHATFVEDLTFELRHYGRGHARGGGTGEAGLPQLLYYLGELRGEFGPAALAAAAAGVVVAFRRSPRRTWLLLAFPLALLAFLCTQRVHFPRNLTALYALLPVFPALALVELSRFAAARLGAVLPGRTAAPAAATVVLVLFAAALPWGRLARSYDVPVDSRRAAVELLAGRAEPGRPVLVAAELQADVRPLLRAGADVRVRPLGELLRAELPRARAPLLVVPELFPGTALEREHGELLRRVAGLRELARFGAGLTPPLSKTPIHGGNPRLLVLERGGP